jgi:orotidine-5'-phosphate decarboxylase
MTRSELIRLIQSNQNFLCVGLDPDVDKFPTHFKREVSSIFEFNKIIIDATYDHCVAYKPNTAFYEAYGTAGWEALEQTIEYIPKERFIIADAKRGDIGNTSSQYAKAFFEIMHCDAVTVAPYMGEDSIKPFMQFDGKWAVVLGLTSNNGNRDFQLLKNENGEFNFESTIKSVVEMGTIDNTMFVIGATNPEYFIQVRKIAPDHFLLVPGVGAQGGSLAEVCKYGLNKDIGLLINSTRDIIYASKELDFALKVGEKAKSVKEEMKVYF